MSAQFINSVYNIEDKKYLELGVYDGSTFKTISSKDKVSVDIENKLFQPDYLMTTDEFFQQLDPQEKFDVVYIDACHQYENVLRDYNNSVDHLSENGLIFMHDLYPPTEDLIKPWYCGDAFKFLNQLLFNNWDKEKMDFYTLDPSLGNYGLTFIKNPKNILFEYNFSQISYSQFVNTSDKLYKVLNMEEFILKIKELSL